MNWDIMIEYFPRLLDGAWLTLQLIFLSGVVGLMLAMPLALMRVSNNRWLQAIPFAYIFFFRGTPLLVQIFLIYYGLSQFDSIKQSVLWEPVLSKPYWCAIIAFSLNTTAYIAEIMRGAIQAVPRGEVEAAQTLGMSKPLMYRRIILPRAFGIALPAYGNEVILMLKGSALASTITLLDLTGMARTIIARTYTPIEIFMAAGLIYLALSFLLIHLFRVLERRLNAHYTI